MDLSKLKENFKLFMILLSSFVGDFAVIYSIIFIIKTEDISWLWIFPVLLITVPVLYFFNRESISIIKYWFTKER